MTRIFLCFFFVKDAEFKEFEPQLKYGWFHLELYSKFQDLSRRSTDSAQIHSVGKYRH